MEVILQLLSTGSRLWFLLSWKHKSFYSIIKLWQKLCLKKQLLNTFVSFFVKKVISEIFENILFTFSAGRKAGFQDHLYLSKICSIDRNLYLENNLANFKSFDFTACSTSLLAMFSTLTYIKSENLRFSVNDRATLQRKLGKFV